MDRSGRARVKPLAPTAEVLKGSGEGEGDNSGLGRGASRAHDGDALALWAFVLIWGATSKR